MISRKLKAYYHNLRGWSTSRKILVLESDDWGAIRMRDKEAYKYLLGKGYPIEKGPFEKYDQLESAEDLKALFAVLNSVKDSKGRPAVFTANTVLANPDFEAIRASGFNEYKYELFTNTYARYYGNGDVWDQWLKGIQDNLFWPQYHAREHYNIPVWLERLRQGDKSTLDAFDCEMVGLPSVDNPTKNDLVVTVNFRNEAELNKIAESFREGGQLFEKVFGFLSKSFIAPVYTWNDRIEEAVFENGVRYLQGGRVQRAPLPPDGKIRLVKHLTGERNSRGQVYLVRNVFFEPSTQADRKAHMEQALTYIKAAFHMRKPAIVSTHRINYMGEMDLDNRARNLELLSELLQRVVKAFPNVEFMTSDQLGDLIHG
jgi:hypothetical protein